MSLVDQHRDETLTRSQRDWLRVREHLQRHRYDLGQAAADLYPDAMRVAGTRLLSRPEWLPAEPLPLDAIDLSFDLDAPTRGVRGDDPATLGMRPKRADGTRYPTYSAAMADLAAPAVFENRPTYRLLAAELNASSARMSFGRGEYFDGIDVGEAAAHEYTAMQLDGVDMALRAAIPNPADTSCRLVNLAISALTIRHDWRSGEAHFLLHWRDPAKVGHAGGLYQVLPVGIFQPSGNSPDHERNDFSLWCCLVREFAEELLGHSEPDGGPIDYERWPFAARLTDAKRRGGVRTYCLGIGVDPLTFATDLLSVEDDDAEVFDATFGGLVDANAEGTIVSGPAAGRIPGVSFSEAQVACMLTNRPIQAAGAAVLALAWSNRQALLAL